MKKTETKTEIKSFFDVANCLLNKKEFNLEENNKHVNQFMINTLLSNDKQLVMIVNEMNRLKITNKMYVDCLYHGIPEMKKYIKWNAVKAEKDKDIMYLMDYFKCSQETAKQYLDIIDETELQYIRDYNEKRGI